jgi:nucleoside-diphosphate-sugar epimerase
VLPRREARRDWVYATDVASGILALLDAPATHHMLYNVSSGARWAAFTLRWCETLQGLFPGLRYRTASETEQPNVSFLGERDRALMTIERLVADTIYRPRHGDDRVLADYAAWLQAHRAYYDDPNAATTIRL